MVERGLASSREKAKALIMAGIVYVNQNKEDKAGASFDPEETEIEVRGATLRYVSRGGLKLEKALKVFPIDLTGRVCMDIGASTGGFTDCMLQNGAAKVYSIDVGYGQLDWKLRNDPRVVCMEKTNFRYVKPEDLGEGPAPSFVHHFRIAHRTRSSARHGPPLRRFCSSSARAQRARDAAHLQAPSVPLLSPVFCGSSPPLLSQGPQKV